MQKKKYLAVLLILALFSCMTGSLESQAKTKVQLSRSRLTLTVGQQKKLSLKGTGKKVKWKSKDVQVATVSTKGLVKAKGKGKTWIIAKASGKKYKCLVTVAGKQAIDSGSQSTAESQTGTQNSQQAGTDASSGGNQQSQENTKQETDSGQPGPVVRCGSKSITLGSTVEQLKSAFGEPARIDEMGGVCKNYVYNSDYAHFLMVDVYDNQVIGVFVNGSDFDVNGITRGSDLQAVNSSFGTSNTNIASLLSLHKDGYVYTFCFDTINTQKVEAAYVVNYSTSIFSRTVASPLVLENMSRQVFDITNAIRVRNGLSTFQWSEQAANSAAKHSQDMADKNYFDHINLEGLTPGDRMAAEGISSMRAAAENIIAGYANPAFCAYEWYNSTGHRANMLSIELTYLGVGFGYNSESSYAVYGTQNFYTPWG